MASSRRFGSLAFATQTLGGGAASAPLFKVPIISGGLSPQKDWGDLPRIGSTLARLGKYAQRARGMGTVRILCHPEAIGLLLYHVCGSQQSSGTSPTEHTYVIGDTYPANKSLTMWSNVGSAAILGGTWRYEDCFISRMRFDGTSGENIEVELEITAFNYVPLSAIPALSGTGNSDENDEPRHKYIGSTVELSPNSGSLEEYAIAERVMFEIDRAPEYRYGPSLTPQIVVPDRLVNLDVSWVFDSDVGGFDWVLEEYTGSVTGTGPDQNVPRGQASVVFGRHPELAGYDFGFDSNGENWQYDIRFPEAEAQPGILEMEATGVLVAPSTEFGGSGTTEATIVLNNDFAGDYA